MDRLPSNRLLAVRALQVMVCHVLSAILAEKVLTTKGFKFPGVYATVEFTTFALVPVLLRAVLNGPLTTWRSVMGTVASGKAWRAAYCGVSMAASHSAGLAATVRINYTTAMLFGAIRLPTIMFAGSFLNPHTKATCKAYLFSLVTTAGLCLFGIAERRDSRHFELSGLALVAANLCLGALTFNLQQRALQRSHQMKSNPAVPIGKGAVAVRVDVEAQKETHSRTSLQPFVADNFMFFEYGAALTMTALYSVISGELFRFTEWCGKHNGVKAELLPVLLGALLATYGVKTLMHVTAEFDAARSSLITSCRKSVTFVISFMLFPKPFSRLHAAGVSLTIGGVFGNQIEANPL